MNVETNGCVCIRWRQETKQSVGNVEVVVERKVAHAHVRNACSLLDRDGRRQRNRPEQPARVVLDPRVEVVDLGAEVDEVILTSIQIQSDKAESPFVDRTVDADVDTTHEAHVRVEKERLRAAVRISPSPGPLYVGDAHEAVEVCDR